MELNEMIGKLQSSLGGMLEDQVQVRSVDLRKTNGGWPSWTEMAPGATLHPNEDRTVFLSLCENSNENATDLSVRKIGDRKGSINEVISVRIDEGSLDNAHYHDGSMCFEGKRIKCTEQVQIPLVEPKGYDLFFLADYKS